MADMRVSNALIINRNKKSDSFIRKIIDDAEVNYGTKKMKT